MNIIIRNTDSTPIYEQIYLQLKAEILCGNLKSGDVLPSIRALAKDLRISVITTKRAYDELEKDGYINTVAAKGCFVAATNNALIREENLKQIEEYLEKTAALAKLCQISTDELKAMIDILEI